MPYGLPARLACEVLLFSAATVFTFGCGSDAKNADQARPKTETGGLGGTAQGGGATRSGAGAGAVDTGGSGGGRAASGGAPSSAGGGTGGTTAGSATNGGVATSGGAGGAGPAGASAGTAGSGGVAGQGGSAGTTGKTPALINNYDGARSSTLSFDLNWKFHLGDATGAEKTTFDDSSWTALDVPHDWSISLAFNQSSPSGAGGGYLDGGLGWYRKSFSLPDAGSDARVYLQFDGVYMDSTVWLNGTQVCARPYGYSSFECNITSALQAGANVVAVKVNNQQPSSRWYSGSGIYRHVWLKTVSSVHVAYTGVSVIASDVSSSSAKLDVAVALQNEAASDKSATVAFSIRDSDGLEVAQATKAATAVPAGKSASVAQSLTVEAPSLWSVAKPALYSLVTTVSADGAVVDTYTAPFGIRSFAFDASSGFSLNGQKMKLNGVCLHHDLGALGAAVNTRALEKRLQMLKDMGVNAIRTSHNPPAPELLDLADRLGFVVMDEAFDSWYNAKNKYDYGRFFKQWANT
ncbi:MAG TPA: glycoside hydrolase family 2 TIM barrel-domain containing protein, partial [Polyangiaceae bacterium]|nr:glycoside hydrolase family 2 TIM barrel-domain containing protein [Polyangiaceae bacterium]